MDEMPVVVGADGSDESLRAVEWAALEADRRRVPLRIVSAPAPLPRMRSPYLSEAAVANALRGMAARNLDLAVERAAEVTQGLVIETDLLSGPAAVAVADCGHGASTLVLGARGSGRPGAMMLGSVSQHGVAHAPCPVVVVPDEALAVQHEIAVGIRDLQDGQGALAFAFEEAELRGAGLLAVHVVRRIPPKPAEGVPAYDPELASAAISRRQMEDMLAAWREKYPTVKVTADVAPARPAQVLASLSARADLLVIGKRTAPDPVIGSIRNAVLIHARGPVAIVPAEVQVTAGVPPVRDLLPSA